MIFRINLPSVLGKVAGAGLCSFIWVLLQLQPVEITGRGREITGRGIAHPGCCNFGTILLPVQSHLLIKSLVPHIQALSSLDESTKFLPGFGLIVLDGVVGYQHLAALRPCFIALAAALRQSSLLAFLLEIPKGCPWGGRKSGQDPLNP